MLGKIMKSSAASRVTEVAAKLDAARANLAEREATKTAAAAAAETALAALDAAALAVARRAAEIAEADLRDAVAIFDAASAALDEAEAEAAAERWGRDAATYRAAVTAAEKATRADLAEVRRLVHGLLRRNAELADRRRALEIERPPSAAPLAYPEAWRSIAGVDEEVISETISHEWCDETGRPLSPEKAAMVRPISSRAGEYTYVYQSGPFTTATATVSVTKRAVRRRTVRERVPAEIATPLAEAIRLPGITAGDRPMWSPTAADAVLTALSAVDAPPPPRVRAMREDVEVID